LNNSDLNQGNAGCHERADGLQHYLLFHAGNLSTKGRAGDREKDGEDGIFHFQVGQINGFYKNASFSRVEQEGLTEMRMEQGFKSNRTGLNVIYYTYDATVNLYLNGFFKPGMIIFINPEIGKTSAEILSYTSISRMLGLGGYYMVLEVELNISPVNGNFETILTTKFMGRGDPRAEIADVDAAGGEPAL